ncbi:chromosomal replication initiator protein DnaA [Candidatus Collierbacteria bacterium CG_4_10_14_0_8_um_filter_43_86]|uniref:Chromosomal replication initiator protein DnaA n=2 Tax=Candidatus Collieribacteriota TaxID=1752725 RepID=A0A2H0DWB6_9BACT|nr:chromosomal replication initiator protein DnaA [bacterium]PIP85999.1 MAG: chromosomal replication initiator protein DnaA [Candidatus Collierbacteria bacterium CG22_combo_CG10-13_8_21_14_all_43_12]PIZ24435.1 MAG: chromosomal replication initiator protein DnaA [Candidatus Collierbacteria bacterium CG_4_10_14_0_8_um_filter_43_86]PJB47080.1 MAG: chromosomal replication initiator protein DnaA [Candidatus Collierbacteria bacterium CG_4_9_14_3_um_filter_43_16]
MWIVLFFLGKLGVVKMWISSENGRMDSEKLWHNICGELGVSMSPASFAGFIKPCFLRSVTPIDEQRLLLELATPSVFLSHTIETKYYSIIKQASEKITEKKCDIALLVVEPVKEAKSSKKENKVGDYGDTSIGLFAPPEENRQTGTNLNPRYVFESYMVGSSNRLAFAAAKAVVDYPGTRHNPLFIYGGVGVGKTHLMHAVGHELAKKGVGKVVCITSEQFTNDLVGSLKSKMTDAFKKKYRQVGALLVDDVQFFGGKDSTQEEFFHTFNELTNKQAQIIMTSDRKPQEIVGLEDRLRSRFLGGMMVDIGLPDYEMRLAILRQRALDIKAEVEDSAFELMANSFPTNARELEGTFVRLATGASINGGVLTREMVQQTMGLPANLVKDIKVRPIKVISTVAKYFDFRNKDLLGESRKADLVVARHIAMYILRDTLKLNLTEVAELMGGRDHTTVIHACEKMEREIERNVDIRRKVMALKQALYT